MSLMRWDAFQEKHPHPFAIVAAIDGRPQRRYELLTRLAEGLSLGGAYALKPRPTSIRLVFEREADARQVAEVVQATRADAHDAGTDAWTDAWTFDFDARIEALIGSRTAAPARKSSGTRGARRKRAAFL